jgi:hypothetical protein
VRSQLFVHHRLFHAIKPQVDAVVEGLAVFVSDELRASLRDCCTVGDIQLLISGVAELDVDDWEASAIYMGGYTAESQEVRWFWRLVRAMDAEQVQLLLSSLSALCLFLRLLVTSLPSNLVFVSLFRTLCLSFSRGLPLCLHLPLVVSRCLSVSLETCNDSSGCAARAAAAVLHGLRARAGDGLRRADGLWQPATLLPAAGPHPPPCASHFRSRAVERR